MAQKKCNKKYSIGAFCKIMPKIELHVHLNGSLNTETLKQLGCNDGSISEYQKFVDIMNKTNRTLEECFELFKVAHNATKTKENVYIATKSVIDDFAQQNTIYLELRTTPRSEENMTKEDYIEAVISAIKDCKKTKPKILVILILSIDRRQEKNVAYDSLNTIIKMKEKYPDIIKGIDLSGDPALGTFDEELFEKARKYGLKTTIHCAEVKNDKEVARILKFRPDRIGHAVFLHPAYGGSQKNWDIYCKEKIPVECCLTSNVITSSVEGYHEHHMQEWINLGLPFSINTDDTGIFSTTLSKEYEQVLRCFKISLSELWNITYNAMDHSFASEEEKNECKDQLLKWYYLCADRLFPKVQINENCEHDELDLLDEIDKLFVD